MLATLVFSCALRLSHSLSSSHAIQVQISTEASEATDDVGEHLESRESDAMFSSQPQSLEALAYRFGTDKSKDDHSFVNLYSMLLDPIREKVQHILEVGVATGQSIKMWHEYFPNAQIYGMDIENVSILDNEMKNFSRARLFRGSSEEK